MSTPTTHSGIVVAVDGSAPAKVAVYWAAREAVMRNVPLTLVHVVRAAVPQWPNTSVPGFVKWLQEKGQQCLDEAMTVVKESTSEGGLPQVNTEMLSSEPVPALVDLSKDAEMIVVGARGLGVVARVVLGSVSSGLVDHAYCPIAVIHDGDPLMPHPDQAPVLVGIDGSPASELATAIAFEEASLRGVELVALHAWSDTRVFDFPGVEWSAMRTIEEETLAERLAGWQDRYPDVKVRRLVVCDQPARQLVKWSEGAQLVVVGSHGRGGFAGMSLGSVSSAVVQSARMPVIVARQP